MTRCQMRTYIFFAWSVSLIAADRSLFGPSPLAAQETPHSQGGPPRFRGGKRGVATISGDERFRTDRISYTSIDGDAIFEGDIVLGTVEEVEEATLHDLIDRASKIMKAGQPGGLTQSQMDIVRFLGSISRKIEPDPAEQAEVGELLARAARFPGDKQDLVSRTLRLLLDRSRRENEDRMKQDRQVAIGDPGVAAPGDPNDFGDVRVQSVVIIGASYRWPDGIIPYEIDEGLPDKERVEGAIAHWHDRTDRIRFDKYDPTNVTHKNYLRFISGLDCSSRVGRKPKPGVQYIKLEPSCLKAEVIHEIGHAVGLWHEQSRNDRNEYLVFHPENVRPNMLFNFDLVMSQGTDVGPFDFSSIMLYPPHAFSSNGKPTMEARVAANGANWGIGFTTTLSDLDVNGVKYLYPQPAKSR